MNDRDYVINSIKENPYKIAYDVGFTDVQKYPHNEWMQGIICGHDDYTLLAHRGSYKSSCLSVCIALLMVLFPQSNIIFLRKADNDVAEMIRMVKKALESDALQSISKVLYHGRAIELTESTASSITTNLFLSASGSSQLLGIGLKSSITGKHADIVITDDICNVSDRISKAERLSNWERDILKDSQKIYAAIDAWACIRIYEEVMRLKENGDYELVIRPEEIKQDHETDISEKR